MHVRYATWKCKKNKKLFFKVSRIFWGNIENSRGNLFADRDLHLALSTTDLWLSYNINIKIRSVVRWFHWNLSAQRRWHFPWQLPLVSGPLKVAIFVKRPPSVSWVGTHSAWRWFGEFAKVPPPVYCKFVCHLNMLQYTHRTKISRIILYPVNVQQQQHPLKKSKVTLHTQSILKFRGRKISFSLTFRARRTAEPLRTDIYRQNKECIHT